MTTLYPLTFSSIYKSKLWGGRKLATHLGKDVPPGPPCGESWEISGLPSDASVVRHGALAGMPLPALVETYRDALVGKSVYERFGNRFPLLVKFIDAADDLSVQVHPGDALAAERHGSPGKTEMWYVIQADRGATLIAGFNQPVSAAACRDRFAAGRVRDILNEEPAEAGDVFYLPAGRIHAIGKGVLVAEIQQASDVTYRIHDYDRADADGRRRTLHVDDALAALDFRCYRDYKSPYRKQPNTPVRVVSCEHFTTNVLDCAEPVVRHYSFDSFVIHVCVHGAYRLDYGWGVLDVKTGDCVLVPAAIRIVNLETATGFRILECYLV